MRPTGQGGKKHFALNVRFVKYCGSHNKPQCLHIRPLNGIFFKNFPHFSKDRSPWTTWSLVHADEIIQEQDRRNPINLKQFMCNRVYLSLLLGAKAHRRGENISAQQKFFCVRVRRVFDFLNCCGLGTIRLIHNVVENERNQGRLIRRSPLRATKRFMTCDSLSPDKKNVDNAGR